jgi:hypothetical protein
MSLSICLVALSLAPAPQVSVELKLKLREDETVKYRNVFNVVTYSPDKIECRSPSVLRRTEKSP